MQFPNYVQKIIDTLRENGYAAYAVGGCVRDQLLQKTPQDYDITTAATPSAVKRVLSAYKTIDTGIQHGTVTVLSDGHPVEVTTYRTESAYSDLRRPDAVCFVTDLAEDLGRRDFTINAMAADADTLIDLHGGQADLYAKRIRCVGDPDRRFNEDGLRILRALRFAAKLDFSIEAETEAAIFRNRENLRAIAVERMTVELDGILAGQACSAVLDRYFEVIEVFLPEAKRDMLLAVKRADADPRIRLALLLDGSDRSVLKRLKYDNRRIAYTEMLWRYKQLPAEKTAVGLALSEIGMPAFADLCAYLDALDGRGAALRRLADSATVCTIADLQIDGHVLQTRFALSGSRIGAALRLLQRAVIDGACENAPAALADYLTQHIDLFR